ncbi:hypothetical protein THMIRHAS_17190 [Thiosulfatimonas sediminis]|uniref:Uncharacterized protein n=1 Tax=Thiosulfatimonas sediminis TaxID=2675054 RepID=A0A6F8PW74_9GAMM|nr:ParB family protein [Thiosulfatimonas sediminis]BBP46346.1 hypothetical protein THMIRHAS_17190 [Thiosulfatimonas sediminis]
MAKKIERVSLVASGNRQAKSQVSEPADPISRTAMRVKVVDIEPYEKNPRKVKNEAYAEIKASIREKGLEQPFTITRRPGEHNYTTRAGGNTRLAVLKELYQETKDEAYLYVHVYFEPYEKEQDLLISHLTENDLRGNLTLLDRARGVVEARDLIEKDLDRKLSIRDLETELKRSGYSLGRTVLSALIYAIEELYPVLPELLEAGAGKPVVERVRKTEGQLKTVWQEIGKDKEGFPEDKFKEVFNESLKEAYKHSESGLDADEIVRAFEAEAALTTGIDIHSIRIKIAESNSPKGQKKPEQDRGEDSTAPLNPIENRKERDAIEEEDESVEDLIEIGDEPTQNTVEPETKSKESDQVKPSTEKNDVDVEGELVEQLLEGAEPGVEEDDLDLLRQIALKQAVLLAEEAGIEDIVIKTNRGFGWALADLPQEIHFTNCGIDDEKPEFKRIWQVWYALYLNCGATLGNQVTKYSDLIAHENDLKALVEERFDDLSDLGQYVTTAALFFNLPLSSSDILNNKYSQLGVITRKLIESATKEKIALWEVQNG